MDTRLDTMAKALARGTTRRQALRRLGGGLAGGTLAGLGLNAAAVQAQSAGVCPVCQRCVEEFFPACISSCAITFGSTVDCASYCCNGLVTTCSILGICTDTCTAACPPS